MKAIFIAFAVILVVAPAAGAEPVRHGFMAGFSFGGGGASACADCSSPGPGGAGELHVGVWLTAQWALSGEAWLYTGDPGRFDPITEGAMLAVVTTRLAPRVWAKAGAGMASYQHQHWLADQLTNTDSTVSYRGLGLGAGIGYEILQSRGSFVLDVSTRSLLAVFPGHGTSFALAGLLGASWN